MTIDFLCPVCERTHTCENYPVVVWEGEQQWCCSEECAIKSKQFRIIEGG